VNQKEKVLSGVCELRHVKTARPRLLMVHNPFSGRLFSFLFGLCIIQSLTILVSYLRHGEKLLHYP